MTDQPQWQHDGGCEQCRFLGRMGAEDAWACMQGGTFPTIIVRSGDSPADYRSGAHVFDALTPELQDAARRWLVEDPDVQIILQTLKDAGGELPIEHLEHRYYERGGT